MTRIVRAAPDGSFDPEQIAASRLFVFPTETVYGLGCRFDDAAAIARVFALKGRGEEKPLAVYLHEAAEVAGFLALDPAAAALARAFLPGPLTLVGRAARPLHPRLLSEGGRVGVRVPDHAGCRAFLRALGAPLAGTSANPSGGESPGDFAAIDPDLLSGTDWALDCGRLAFGRASTVVDVSGPAPKILREGVVSAAEIRRALEVG